MSSFGPISSFPLSSLPFVVSPPVPPVPPVPPSPPVPPVPPIAPFASPFAAIAAAIPPRLAQVLQIDQAYCFLVASADYKVTVLEPLFCYVQIFPPRPFPDAGAGRLYRPVHRFARIYIYTRSGEDTYGDDSIALAGDQPTTSVGDFAGEDTTGTAAAVRHFLAEELVFDALDNWVPTLPDDSRMLTNEPVHTTTENTEPERKPEDDEGLIRSSLDFDILYTLPVRKADPSPIP